MKLYITVWGILLFEGGRTIQWDVLIQLGECSEPGSTLIAITWTVGCQKFVQYIRMLSPGRLFWLNLYTSFFLFMISCIWMLDPWKIRGWVAISSWSLSTLYHNVLTRNFELGSMIFILSLLWSLIKLAKFFRFSRFKICSTARKMHKAPQKYLGEQRCVKHEKTVGANYTPHFILFLNS